MTSICLLLFESNSKFDALSIFPNFKIYTITVLNSSSTDQWSRKDISSNSGQSTALDINLDTILSNYPYVKTECFSYDDSGFGATESTKEDINYQHQPTPQLLQTQSTGVTTTSITIVESNPSATDDLISYTDMSNNNTYDEIKDMTDWETCEANVRIINYLINFIRNARIFVDAFSMVLLGIARVASSFSASG